MRRLARLLWRSRRETSAAYQRGRAAWRLLDHPEKRDARIAELERQLADPTITKDRNLIRRECELLTKARDADHAANPLTWCV